ncbi:MAG: GltB/FmdC/FwdC-like GXGXG domain-containing protein [Candidatus Methanofastidiosia archaeon]
MKIKKYPNKQGSITIDAKNKTYRELNSEIRAAADQDICHITLQNVLGQRFIADGIKKEGIYLSVFGIAGGDLGVFMDGPIIYVNGNAEHAPGNTMSGGKIIIDGDAGDCVGHSMRGGIIFVKGNAGYRTGIHMKQFKDNYPTIVIGGSAQSFLGEYMAGGIIVILNIDKTSSIGDYIGTGMHGGAIYIAGDVPDYKLGVATVKDDFIEEDRVLVEKLVDEYNAYFNKKVDFDAITFTKIRPISLRPFSNMYTTE